MAKEGRKCVVFFVFLMQKAPLFIYLREVRMEEKEEEEEEEEGESGKIGS